MFQRDYPLHHYNDVPNYMRHNKYLLTGYRVHLTVRQVVASLFHVHNESLNVWTHLLGFLLFGYLLYDALDTWLVDGLPIEKALLAVYTTSAQILLACSTLFHLFHCLGQEHYSALARCDYTGISVLIAMDPDPLAGSYFLPLYYVFICSPMAFTIYASLTIVVALLAIYVSFNPTFEKPGYESLRAGVFIAMALFFAMLVPHILYIYPAHLMWPVLLQFMHMGAYYLGGVIFYVFQIPERFFPGSFDLTCHSHVIWHCFVVLGAYQHFNACRFMVEYSDTLIAACSIP